jgi:hypothetical protein
MHTLLLTIAVLASVVAVAAIVALFAAFRGERRRSEARVAALRELAGDANPADELPLAPFDLVDLDNEREASSRPMFGGTAAPTPWKGRAAAAAAVAVIVAALGYVLLADRPATARDVPVVAAPAKALSPLELLSLRHRQEEGKLVITGLVQNPRAGVPLSKVIATAFLLDAAGTLLASGRAPLDFSTLAPGDESPFVLSVPVTAAVARYRIGFRGEDGRVIAHVDRRAAGTLARGE